MLEHQLKCLHIKGAVINNKDFIAASIDKYGSILIVHSLIDILMIVLTLSIVGEIRFLAFII
jgi:hypothetical protein